MALLAGRADADRNVRSGAARRVALVSDEQLSFGGDATNGFGVRYANVAAAISDAGHELLVVSIGRNRTDDPRPERRAGEALGRYVPLDWSPSRDGWLGYVDVARSALLGRTPIGPARAWERSLVDELHRFRPDVVLVAAPFRPSLCLLVDRSVPVVYFAEEDLRSLGGAGAHIRREQQLTQLRPPRVVVTIAEPERRWAGRRWRRTTVMAIPHGIDVDHWSTPVDPEPRWSHPVFTVGDYGHQRNLEGLLAVADEIERRGLGRSLSIGVASAAPLITPAVTAIHPLGTIADPRRGYASARIALVPAFEVTGVKTQVLQAWAAGCPVVTTTDAARSVQGRDGRDLAAAPDAAGVVDRLQELMAHPDQAARLVEAGARAVRARFSMDALTSGLSAALRAATR